MIKNKIIAIDFDGTCVTHEYPNIGKTIGAEEVIKNLAVNNKIILFTMRSGKELQDAVDWFENIEVNLFGINCNPDQHTWTNSPKPYAHVYIDDAALGCPLIYPKEGRPYVNWRVINDLLP